MKSIQLEQFGIEQRLFTEDWSYLPEKIKLYRGVKVIIIIL